jgi:hypothetical protein
MAMENPGRGSGPSILRDGNDDRIGGRAPLGWQITCWALVALASGYDIATMVQLWIVVSTDHALITVQTDGSGAVLEQHLSHLYHLASIAKATDLAFWMLLVVLIVVFVVWRRSSVGLIRKHGCDDVKPMLRHWSMRVWIALLMISVIIAYSVRATTALGNDMEAVRSQLRWMEMRYALRAVAVVFLVLGIVLVNRRIRRFVADHTLTAKRLADRPGAAGLGSGE